MFCECVDNHRNHQLIILLVDTYSPRKHLIGLVNDIAETASTVISTSASCIDPPH
jgi:hypothetical protein